MMPSVVIRGQRREARAIAISFPTVNSALPPDIPPPHRGGNNGQFTDLYMNLTRKDGASLVAVHTGEAAAIVIRVTVRWRRALRLRPSVPHPSSGCPGRVADGGLAHP